PDARGSPAPSPRVSATRGHRALSRDRGEARTSSIDRRRPGGRLLRRRDANGSPIGTGGGRSPRSVLSSEPLITRIGGSPLTTGPAPTSPAARRDRAANPDTSQGNEREC